MADEAPEGQSLSAMLTDRNKLALLHNHLNLRDMQMLRLVCAGARAAHDQLARCLRVISEDDLMALRGLLLRGCRPDTVALGRFGGQQELQVSACLRLLRTFTEVSASAPLPTTELTIPAACLCPGTAHAAAIAFPKLSSLTLTGAEGSVGEDAAASLSLLLGTGGAGAPLIPGLQDLTLGSATTPLLDALRGASQLRRLAVESCPADASTVEVMGTLTGLRSLTLGNCSEELLPHLLAPLTSLTALDLSITSGALPAPALAGLCGLRDLTAVCATLDPSALQGLSRLTRLQLDSLESPAGGPNPSATAPASWQLPPELSMLLLLSQQPEELCGLQPAPSRPGLLSQGHITASPRLELLVECFVFLRLQPGRHFNSEDGCLLPAGEEALCGAAAALAGRMAPVTSVIGVRINYGLEPIRPVGGEAGPGRRNHARWLEALGRTGVLSLQLSGIALSHQDFETIVETCTGRKVLELYMCGHLPMGSLPRLARLPRLERVVLDVDAWCGPQGEGPLTVPVGAMGSVLALCSSPDFRGVVILRTPHVTDEDKARLGALVRQLHEQLEAMGLDRRRLVLA